LLYSRCQTPKFLKQPRAIAILSILLICLTPTAYAQVAFTRLTEEDGLGNNSIQCILQDKSGIVWIGTNGGLNRYDGAGFISYNILSKPALGSNIIAALLEDDSGRIWVGTENGLDLLDPVANTIRTAASVDGKTGAHLPGPVKALQRARDGSIWIMGESWLSRWTSGGGFRRIRIDPSLLGPTKVFTGIPASDDYRLWVSYLDQPAAQARLYRLPGGEDSIGITGTYWPGCAKAYPDTAGHDWGVSYYGISRYDRKTGQFEHWLKNSSAQNIPDLHLYTCYSTDAEGDVWAGSRQLNLVKYDLRRRQVMDYNGLLTTCNATMVNCIYRDRSNTLWIGTDNGIIKLSGRSFLFSPITCLLQGREQKEIRCRKIIADSSGVMYAGTESHGLLRLQNAVGGKYAMEQLSDYGAFPVSSMKIQDNSYRVPLNGRFDIGYIYDLWYDGGTTIWFAGYGLGRFDTRTKVADLYLSDGDAQLRNESITIFSICRDDSLFWLGGQHNIFIFNTGRKRMQALRDEKGAMPFEGIACWSVVRSGRWIWAGTEKGLYRIDRITRVVTREDTHPALGLSINAIHLDTDSSLWISTAGGGVLHYHPETHGLQQYTTREGLSNNMVCGLLPDDDHNLWISTYSGLDCLDPKTGVFTVFYAKDGLNMNEFNRKAFARLADGRMIFGGLNGYISFDPRQILRANKPASLFLTRFGRGTGNGLITDSVFGVQALRQIAIGPQNPFFSLSYTLSDLYDPARNLYSYRMEGLDTAWHAIGNQHTLSFISLPAGRYTLQLKGSPAQGGVAGNMIAVAITVEQVLYKRPWFLILCGVLVAGVIIAIGQYRLYQYRKLHQLRTRIASDLHDEVGSNLVRIALLADADRNGTAAGTAVQRLDVIAGISRDAASTVRDVVWSIDARYDTLSGMQEHMHEHLHQMLAPAGIEYVFSHSGVSSEEKLGMEFRQNIYRIFREAINNIVKHSGASVVEVSVGREAGSVHLKIKDNGRGLNGKKTGSGQGLANMKMRAERIGGSLELVSGERGLEITLVAPL
jgi:signal transduction histidine kinase/ligand-binding sensor domain-containing protein